MACKDKKKKIINLDTNAAIQIISYSSKLQFLAFWSCYHKDNVIFNFLLEEQYGNGCLDIYY